MPSRAYNSFLLAKPILIGSNYVNCVNALSGLYLFSTVSLQKPRFYVVSRTYFWRDLSKYSNNSFFVHINNLDMYIRLAIALATHLFINSCLRAG